MTRVDYAIGSDKLIPFAGNWADAKGMEHGSHTRTAESARNHVVHELTLTGAQLAVGCICVLGAIRLALRAVLRLWLFEP